MRSGDAGLPTDTSFVGLRNAAVTRFHVGRTATPCACVKQEKSERGRKIGREQLRNQQKQGVYVWAVQPCNGMSNACMEGSEAACAREAATNICPSV